VETDHVEVTEPHKEDNTLIAKQSIEMISHASSDSFEKVEIPTEVEERELKPAQTTLAVPVAVEEVIVKERQVEDMKSIKEESDLPEPPKAKEVLAIEPETEQVVAVEEAAKPATPVEQKLAVPTPVEKKMSLHNIEIPKESDFNVSKLIDEAEARAMGSDTSQEPKSAPISTPTLSPKTPLKDDNIEPEPKPSFTLGSEKIELAAPAPAVVSERQPVPPSRSTMDLKRKKSSKSTKSKKSSKCTIL
jgi:hypothetical protein